MTPKSEYFHSPRALPTSVTTTTTTTTITTVTRSYAVSTVSFLFLRISSFLLSFLRSLLRKKSLSRISIVESRTELGGLPRNIRVSLWEFFCSCICSGEPISSAFGWFSLLFTNGGLERDSEFKKKRENNGFVLLILSIFWKHCLDFDAIFSLHRIDEKKISLHFFNLLLSVVLFLDYFHFWLLFGK